MKIKIISLFLFLFSFTALSQSWDISLNWTAAQAYELVTNYVVYQATGTNEFVSVATTQTQSITLTNIPPGPYRYRVAALNAWGEGPASVEVSTPPGLPTQPSNINITIIINGQGTVNILNRSLKR